MDVKHEQIGIKQEPVGVKQEQIDDHEADGEQADDSQSTKVDTPPPSPPSSPPPPPPFDPLYTHLHEFDRFKLLIFPRYHLCDENHQWGIRCYGLLIARDNADLEYMLALNL
jgi:hypothetical protein